MKNSSMTMGSMTMGPEMSKQILSRRNILRWLTPVGTLLLSCAPEGDGRVPTVVNYQDPCTNPEYDLTGGIQDGDDLMAVFECLNKDGMLDAFAPTVEAMYTSTTSDGNRTILDMWAEILQQELEAVSGSGLTLQVSDLVPLLDSTLQTLEEPWVDTAVSLVGDVLESGAGEPAMPVLGQIAHGILTTSSAGGYDAVLDNLVALICPETNADDRCVGDVVQLYSQMNAISASYDPDNPDQSGYPLPSGESVATLLAGLLAPAGSDIDMNNYLNAGLGRGVANLGQGTFLQETLAESVPALYGDDPDTDELEGYEYYNANTSALFGILNALNDEEFYSQLTGMLNELDPLLNKYYQFSLTTTGYAVAVRNNGCALPTKTRYDNSTDFASDNSANYGFAQILRLLKAANVSYRDNPICQTTITAALPILVDTYHLELSGSTNIATLMLEAFSQMPVDDVIFATDASNLPQTLLEAINSTCGLNVLQDDMEALQKSVHMPTVIEPTLKLLKMVNHAARQAENETLGAGSGGMETIKNLLVGLYDTQMICEAQPWLGTTLQPGNVLTTSTTGLQDYLPGGKWHDTLTLPLLRTLARLGGAKANSIVPPIATGLRASGTHLGPLLTGLGQFGRQATLEANAGQSPALYELNSLLKEIAAFDPNNQGIDGVVAVLDERILVNGILETVGNQSVANALGATDPDGNAPVAYLSHFVNSGQLEGLLNMVRQLLSTLSTAIEGGSATTESSAASSSAASSSTATSGAATSSAQVSAKAAGVSR